MVRINQLILALLALVGGACAGRAEEPPKYWAVTGVKANDALHLRDVPSADSKSLARIPPNARGLKHLGCRRNQPPMDQWVRMSEKARHEAMTQWCRIEYRGQEGWVAGRFLKPDAPPRR
jgi:predicted Fe-S protein YdhL (DUF1289 family)